MAPTLPELMDVSQVMGTLTYGECPSRAWVCVLLAARGQTKWLHVFTVT